MKILKGHKTRSEQKEVDEPEYKNTLNTKRYTSKKCIIWSTENTGFGQ